MAGVTRVRGDRGRAATRGRDPCEDHRARAQLRKHGRIQRIGRRRHEHLAVLVEERGQRQLDTFRGSGGNQNPIRVDRPSVPRGALSRDGLPRGCDTCGWAVAVMSVVQRALDRVDKMDRRFETEGDGIADIQIADP